MRMCSSTHHFESEENKKMFYQVLYLLVLQYASFDINDIRGMDSSHVEKSFPFIQHNLLLLQHQRCVLNMKL